MTVHVSYFAWLRERMGRNGETLDLAPGVATVSGLAAWLQQRDDTGRAAFAEMRSIRAAVNKRFAQPGDAVVDGDEVAFFPPVTGG